jgi:hypothetical protein
MQLVSVHESRRFLRTEDGSPFFWLGDTTWELFHRLSRKEIADFLSIRHQQGFNIIQAVALAELDGIRVPNREGHFPLIDEDPSKPDLRAGGYWDLVDFAFDVAEKEQIYIALLPTWGDKIKKDWGVGPEIFTIENARAYGEFIGKRYGHRDNLNWIMGGDRSFEPQQLEIVRAMAEGIRATEAKRHLMSFHPVGGKSSSAEVLNEPWLDMHMNQSGHWWFDMRPDLMIENDLKLDPYRPSLDGEPCYENHRPFKGFMEYKDLNIPVFDAYYVRRACYQSVFAGGCGVTYGCHAIWQMAQPMFEPVNYPIGYWHQSMQLPGARQLVHLRDLVSGPEYFDRIAYQSLILVGLGEGADTARAWRTASGKRAAIYLPSPRPLKVDRSQLQAGPRSYWFDPRTGIRIDATPIDETFHAPTAEDWVLLFEAD